LAEPPEPPRSAAAQPLPRAAAKAAPKAVGAFRTIGELAIELGVAPHVLRYWETRFPQLKPLQRAGNRRYYRPEDAALARRIHELLSVHGYTVKGVQALLARTDPSPSDPASPATGQPSAPTPTPTSTLDDDHRAAMIAIRNALAEALIEDSNET